MSIWDRDQTLNPITRTPACPSKVQRQSELCHQVVEDLATEPDTQVEYHVLKRNKYVRILSSYNSTATVR